MWNHSYHRKLKRKPTPRRYPYQPNYASLDASRVHGPYELSYQGPDVYVDDTSPDAIARRIEDHIRRGAYGRGFDRLLATGDTEEVLDILLARLEAQPGMEQMADPFYFDVERVRSERAARIAHTICVEPRLPIQLALIA